MIDGDASSTSNVSQDLKGVAYVHLIDPIYYM